MAMASRKNAVPSHENGMPIAAKMMWNPSEKPMVARAAVRLSMRGPYPGSRDCAQAGTALKSESIGSARTCARKHLPPVNGPMLRGN